MFQLYQIYVLIMESIGTRLGQLIIALGVSKNQFSKQIGTSSAMISKVTGQKINFGIEIIEKIIKAYPQLNIDWLLTGIGSMWRENHNNEVQLNPQLSTNIGKNKKDQFDVSVKITSEADLIEKIRNSASKADFMFQKLVDVRILLEEQLDIKQEYSTKKETELLWDLAKVDMRDDPEGNASFKYKYEIVDLGGKIKINTDLEACVELFNNTFFKEFKKLYMGLRKKKGTLRY